MFHRNRIFASLLPLAVMAVVPGAQAGAAALQNAGAPVALTAGVAVKDTAGGDVGTITSVDGGFAIVKTDRHEVRLPLTSMTATPAGALLGMTRDELNASVDQALAQAGPVLSVGATVHGSAGGVIGTVEEFDEQFATVKLDEQTKVRLPVEAFGRGENGPVIGMTVEELRAAAGG